MQTHAPLLSSNTVWYLQCISWKVYRIVCEALFLHLQMVSSWLRCFENMIRLSTCWTCKAAKLSHHAVTLRHVSHMEVRQATAWQQQGLHTCSLHSARLFRPCRPVTVDWGSPQGPDRKVGAIISTLEARLTVKHLNNSDNLRQLNLYRLHMAFRHKASYSLEKWR